MQQYPVNLNLAGRRCVLVGAGRIALRKAEQLIACGAVLTVIAPEIDPAFDELARTPGTGGEPALWLVRRPYRSGDLDGHRLVITATGDAVVDQQVHDDAELLGLWVNAADDPARCSFTLPAVVRRGPVAVTVSTGGASPALASWLRDHLAADPVLAGEGLALVAAELAARRAEVHATGGSTEDIDWRPLIESLVALHGPSAPELAEVGR